MLFFNEKIENGIDSGPTKTELCLIALESAQEEEEPEPDIDTLIRTQFDVKPVGSSTSTGSATSSRKGTARSVTNVVQEWIINPNEL